MGKYYKVPLFQYRNNDVQKVDDIIVKRDILGTAREIVSEITIDIYTQKEGPTRNDHIIVDYDIEQRGVYLFVRKKDMNTTSFATTHKFHFYLIFVYPIVCYYFNKFFIITHILLLHFKIIYFIDLTNDSYTQ